MTQPALQTTHPTSSRPPASGRSILPDLSKLPASIRHWLDDNRYTSQQFCVNAPDRAKWFAGHQFRIAAAACIDGRMSDLSKVLGLPPGIATIHRDDGCIHLNGNSRVYWNRVNSDVRKAERYQRATIHFVTAHYSASALQTNSCAAWGHDINQALEHAKREAKVLNLAFSGRVVAIPLSVETDSEGLTLYGPNGEIDTALYKNLGEGKEFHKFLERAQEVFPLNWGPIQMLERQEWRQAFHVELAERLVENVRFMRSVRSERRPIQTLDHLERILVIGGDLETDDHNAALLVSDLEPETIRENVTNGLPYIVRNILRLAPWTGDWIVPIIINVPYGSSENGEQKARRRARAIWYGPVQDTEEGLAQIPQHGLRWHLAQSRIRARIAERVTQLCEKEGIVCPPKEELANRLHDQMIHACVCISSKETRRLVPII